MVNNMERLKILIIPSWYPNKKDPLWGNYFIKQAEALSEYADVTMLYVNRVGLKEIKNLIKEKKTDGYSSTKYKFKFYKISIPNLKTLSLELSYKKYAKAAYNAYKKLELIEGVYDVILVQSALPAGIAARYIYKKEGIPYVVHAHSENIMDISVYKDMIKDIVSDAKAYMAVNKKIQEKVNKLNKECELVPNFIDCKKFDIKKNIDKKDFVLVNICNFYKVKALDILLKSLSVVVNKGYTNVKLKIVGTGEYKYYYESIVNSLKLKDYVEFMGYVDNNDIPKILSEANALCVSSTFETFCIPLIESLASGIPVITTDCEGPREIVNKKVGLIVPINDVNAYANAIIDLINNYSKYDSKALKKYAFNNYDKEVICKKIINICKEK